jgi:glycosyltransferase involved in cell wall biosynthesis
MRDLVTPLLITYNEAPNIARALSKLAWAKRIVVIDSGSTDGTIEVLARYPQVETIHRPFTDFAEQWNFGFSYVSTPWVLSLDADYESSDEIIGEMLALAPSEEVSGYAARFIYRIYSRPLRGALYPERTVLFRKNRAQYRMDGHTQRVVVDGIVLALQGPIYHDDRKPLSRWFASQQRYARDEAAHLVATPRQSLSRADRLRLIAWPAPLAVFFYVLFVKRCILDGWPGWFYALQRTIAEMLLALELIELRLQGTRTDSQGFP